MSREGIFWLIASVALLVTGLFKGINLINLLTCSMISLAVLNVIVAGRQLRGLQAKRLDFDPIFAKTPFPLQLELHNASKGRRAGILISDAAMDGPAHWFVNEIKAGESIALERAVVYARRGLQVRGPLIASCGFPFGLALRQKVLADKRQYIVLPQVLQLFPGALRRLLSSSDPALGHSFATPVRHAAAQSEVHGLRPYRPGDSPRWIHWRTTARRGELMVREYEDIPTEQLTLILDPWLPAELPASAAHALLEDTISLAASVIWDWCRQTGNPLVVAVAGRAPLLLSGATSRELALQLLERLATEDGYTFTDHEPLLARLASSRLTHGRVLVICTQVGELVDRVALELHCALKCVSVADEGLDAYADRNEPPAQMA